MGKTYTNNELRNLLKNKKWIMRYNSLYAVVDPITSRVMYIEDYGPHKGFFIEGWRAHHFPLTSSIVHKSYREAGITAFILSQGKAKLKLIPSFAPIGIEECRVTNKSVIITIAGFGGGGVSASFSRGMADGVDKIEVLKEGGGDELGKGRLTLPKKHLLLIGVDDTDNEFEGATYSLAHNIATDIASNHSVYYAIHNNVQLYPNNPFKTRNCMSTVIGFIYDKKSQREKIIKEFIKQLKKNTVSKETSMVVFDGFDLPKEIINFGKQAKSEFIDNIEGLKTLAKKYGVEIHVISGERGLIGAMASLAYYDRPVEAALLI
jgi:methanogenesis imperfect marker protein 11